MFGELKRPNVIFEQDTVSKNREKTGFKESIGLKKDYNYVYVYLYDTYLLICKLYVNVSLDVLLDVYLGRIIEVGGQTSNFCLKNKLATI